MAQYYEAKEMREKLEKQLNIYGWEITEDGAFRIELPVVLYFNYQRLALNITPTDDGYVISDDGETFIEYSSDTEYYFELFDKNDGNYHFDIALKDGYICKSYGFDYSLTSAIDEFIRFFISLDEFMGNNDIT